MDSHTSEGGQGDALAEGRFYITHPNKTRRRIRLEFDTMEEAMKFWKGFNTPYCKGDSFVQSEKRLKAYMMKLYDSQD